MLVISLEKKYVHVRQRARNVHLKIYDMQEMYVHVTYRTNKWFLNFFWLIIYLYFCILARRLLTVRFIQTFFFHNHKILSIKMFCLFKDINFPLTKGFEFRMVTIFSLNYRYINIICILLLYTK